MVRVYADGKVESFKSDIVGKMYATDMLEKGHDVKVVAKRVFSDEVSATEFSKNVGGTCRQRVLPDYMSVDIVYVVEWEDTKWKEK